MRQRRSSGGGGRCRRRGSGSRCSRCKNCACPEGTAWLFTSCRPAVSTSGAADTHAASSLEPSAPSPASSPLLHGHQCTASTIQALGGEQATCSSGQRWEGWLSELQRLPAVASECFHVSRCPQADYKCKHCSRGSRSGCAGSAGCQKKQPKSCDVRDYDDMRPCARLHPPQQRCGGQDTVPLLAAGPRPGSQ